MTTARTSILAALLCGLLPVEPGLAEPRASADTAPHQRYFVSGPQQTSLIELYTSEGCSSCPPADRWLSGLKDDDALWRDIVPLAFHVSYWDRLGWPDRFAQQQFDTRHRALAARADAGVYTPGLFWNGVEFRTWRRGLAQPDGLAATHGDALTGAGRLEVAQQPDGHWQLSYQPATGGEHPGLRATEAFIAILGNDLSNDVTRGENAGRRLSHDFVVLALQHTKLRQTKAQKTTTVPSGGNAPLTASFSLDPSYLATSPRDTSPRDPSSTVRLALAAWVVDSRGMPVQALGGEL